MFKQTIVLAAAVMALAMIAEASKQCKKPSACDPAVYQYTPPGPGRIGIVCKQQCACLAEKRDLKGFNNENCCTFVQCPTNPKYDRSEYNNYHKEVCPSKPTKKPAPSQSAQSTSSSPDLDTDASASAIASASASAESSSQS